MRKLARAPVAAHAGSKAAAPPKVEEREQFEDLPSSVKKTPIAMVSSRRYLVNRQLAIATELVESHLSQLRKRFAVAQG